MVNPTKILSCSCIIFIFPVLILSQNDTSYYNLCSPFKCGDITFSFPFSLLRTFGSGLIDYCGIPGYQITCADEESPPVPKLILSSRLYQVKDIFLDQPNDPGGWNLITLVDTDLIRELNSSSCKSLSNLTFPVSGNNNALDLPPRWNNNTLKFAKCPPQFTPSQDFLSKFSSNYSCSDDGNQLYLLRYNITEFNLPPGECLLFEVPASPADVSKFFSNVSVVELTLLTEALAAGFPLQWNTSNECESCKNTSGHCGFNGKNVVCLCRDSEDLNLRDCIK